MDNSMEGHGLTEALALAVAVACVSEPVRRLPESEPLRFAMPFGLSIEVDVLLTLG